MYSPFAKLHMNYTDGCVTAFPFELAHMNIHNCAHMRLSQSYELNASGNSTNISLETLSISFHIPCSSCGNLSSRTTFRLTYKNCWILDVSAKETILQMELPFIYNILPYLTKCHLCDPFHVSLQMKQTNIQMNGIHLNKTIENQKTSPEKNVFKYKCCKDIQVFLERIFQ